MKKIPQEAHLTKTRAPVKRASAEAYVLLSLASFGLTVAATRIFLQLAGYPQVGNSVLHIAHAIWGGLLLFVAVLVTLILANRWAFTVSAILSGIGVGLFIDEVGKFITQTNDYFFPPAAPLIYSVFLLMILLFLFVRRARPVSPRASMYRALLELRDVLDNDLDPRERDRLLIELNNGRAASAPHIALLAEQLSAYLQDECLPLTSYRPGLWTRLNERARAVGERLGRQNHRRLIMALIALVGAFTLLVAALLAVAWAMPERAEEILSTVLLSATELTTQRPVWLVVRLGLQLLVGLLYLLALLQLWRGREEAGLTMAIFAALVSFTALNLLNFYLNQFGALIAFFFNFALFLLMLAYRSWYLAPGGDQPSSQREG
jgi:hypothetical protein